MRQGRIAARLPGPPPTGGGAAAIVRLGLAIQVWVTRSLALAEGAQPVSVPKFRLGGGYSPSLQLHWPGENKPPPAVGASEVTPQTCKLGPGGSPA